MGEATNRGIFLSYASQDAEAARRICEALRASGVEVWFDESELRGGDSWDAKIRRQIKECALFMPIISASTQARAEGYFRVEWRLADRRTEAIGKSKAFIVPVCIDDTREGHADVPDSFCAVQWTRLPAGETSPEFCGRVIILLGNAEGSRSASVAAESARPSAALRPASKHRWRAVTASIVVLGATLTLWQPWKKTVLATGRPGATPALSQARQLTAKADALFDQDEAPPRENLNLAEQFCRQAIALDPNDAEIWAIFSRVGSYSIFRTFDRSKERIAQAGDAAKRAVRLAPDSFEARYALAYFYRLDDATYAEAERMLRTLLDERPGDKRFWRALGYTLRAGTTFAARSRGRLEESLECFRRAAALPGGDPLALQYESAALAQLGRLDEAEKAVDAAIRLKPLGSAPVTKVNQMLRYRGDVARAREALANVPVEYLREDYAAFIASQTWWCAREPDKAIEVLKAMPRDYLEAVFDGPKGFLIGQAHRLAGRSQAAAIEWRAALQLIERRIAAEPNHVRPLMWKSCLLAHLGEHEEARRLLAAAEELGLSANDCYWAATTALELGDRDKLFALLTTAAKEAVVVTRPFLRISTTWDRVRNDPRFQALVEEPEKITVSSSLGQKSIAVLPFKSLGGDAENEIFSEGISDELISVLGKIPGLQVAARMSSFSNSIKGAKPQQVGQELGVSYLLEGRVQRASGRVRINARLVNAADGFAIWESGNLERELKDVWAVQDEIAAFIAQNLSLTLGASSRPAKTVNPDAHRLVLEARHFMRLRTDEASLNAEKVFLQAIAADPDFAPAHSGLAEVYAIRATYAVQDGASESVMADAIGRARAAVARAQSLDGSFAEAYAISGHIFTQQGLFAEAEREFEKAERLNPNEGMIFTWRSVLRMAQGRLRDALRDQERAERLDPLWPIALAMHGESLMYARQLQLAREKTGRLVALRPDNWVPNIGNQAKIFWALGERDEAIEAARQVRRQLAKKEPRRDADAAAIWVLARAGRREEANALAQEAMRPLAPNSYQRGFLLGALGRFEEALPLLERTPPVPRRRLYWDAMWDEWRQDARFTRLMEKLGCTAEYQRAREELARIESEGRKK